MPLKLQAHVDSRIWSLQSTVSFFFYRLYGTAKYYLRLNLRCSWCIFFQNVRKMHFFPMFRNGVKWHKCHIPLKLFTIRCLAFPYVHIFGLLRIPFFVLRTKSSASMALTKTKKQNKKKKTTKQNNPPPPQKKKIKKK